MNLLLSIFSADNDTEKDTKSDAHRDAETRSKSNHTNSSMYSTASPEENFKLLFNKTLWSLAKNNSEDWNKLPMVEHNHGSSIDNSAYDIRTRQDNSQQEKKIKKTNNSNLLDISGNLKHNESGSLASVVPRNANPGNSSDEESKQLIKIPSKGMLLSFTNKMPLNNTNIGNLTQISNANQNGGYDNSSEGKLPQAKPQFITINIDQTGHKEKQNKLKSTELLSKVFSEKHLKQTESARDIASAENLRNLPYNSSGKELSKTEHLPFKNSSLRHEHAGASNSFLARDDMQQNKYEKFYNVSGHTGTKHEEIMEFLKIVAKKGENFFVNHDTLSQTKLLGKRSTPFKQNKFEVSPRQHARHKQSGLIWYFKQKKNFAPVNKSSFATMHNSSKRDLTGFRTVKTKGGLGEGKSCVFPFIYGGNTYYECISSEIKPAKRWCAKTSNYDRDLLWGYCVKRKSRIHPSKNPLKKIKGDYHNDKAGVNETAVMEFLNDSAQSQLNKGLAIAEKTQGNASQSNNMPGHNTSNVVDSDNENIDIDTNEKMSNTVFGSQINASADNETKSLDQKANNSKSLPMKIDHDDVDLSLNGTISSSTLSDISEKSMTDKEPSLESGNVNSSLGIDGSINNITSTASESLGKVNKEENRVEFAPLDEIFDNTNDNKNENPSENNSVNLSDRIFEDNSTNVKENLINSSSNSSDHEIGASETETSKNSSTIINLNADIDINSTNSMTDLNPYTGVNTSRNNESHFDKTNSASDQQDPEINEMDQALSDILDQEGLSKDETQKIVGSSNNTSIKDEMDEASEKILRNEEKNLMKGEKRLQESLYKTESLNKAYGSEENEILNSENTDERDLKQNESNIQEFFTNSTSNDDQNSVPRLSEEGSVFENRGNSKDSVDERNSSTEISAINNDNSNKDMDVNSKSYSNIKNDFLKRNDNLSKSWSLNNFEKKASVMGSPGGEDVFEDIFEGDHSNASSKGTKKNQPNKTQTSNKINNLFTINSFQVPSDFKNIHNRTHHSNLVTDLQKSRARNLHYVSHEDADEIETYGGNSFTNPCVFPFIYHGDTYFNCIEVDRDKSWCATTHSYDKAPLWGYCCFEKPCRADEVGDIVIQKRQKLFFVKLKKNARKNVQNVKKYKLQDRFETQKETVQDRFKIQKKLVDIHTGSETYGGNSFGAHCVIPFIYNGRPHFTCIRRDDDSSWCSTTRDFDKDLKWGNCCRTSKCKDPLK